MNDSTVSRGEIVRVVRRVHPFLIMDKSALEDPRLSFRAKGLLAYLLSRPDTWVPNREHLASVSSREGVTAIRTALTELREAGYFERRREKRPTDQTFYFVSYIYEVSQRPLADYPPVAEPPVGDPPADERSLVKKEEQRRKKEEPSSAVEKPTPRVKVAKEALDHLTEAYAELRGVRPQGKEWLPIQQGVRQALLDGNTVEQIDGCMRQLAALGWTWTINTMRRWLPDYRAGKLQELQPDGQRAMGHDPAQYDRALASRRSGSPEWIDDLTEQYRRIVTRIRGMETDIALERETERQRATAEEIPAELRARMGKLLDGAGDGGSDSIAEMEARRSELEERARDIAERLARVGVHVEEKVRA